MAGLKDITLKINGTQFTIGLDNSEGDINYLSHAHADHLFSFKKKVVCSPTTALLAEIKEELVEFNFKKEIKLYNAGHIIGSTQIKLTTEEFGEVVYSGDLKLRDGLTTKAAEIVECDTLIIDGTYGAYDIKFRELQTYQEMKKWAEENKNCNIIWGGYKIGKAQEIIKFLNDYLNISPLVSKEIASVCKIYQKEGIKLDYIELQSQEAKEILKGQFHAVLDFQKVNDRFIENLNRIYKNKTLGALATGWAYLYQKKSNFIKMFGLSDHADFSEILQYCQQSGAKRVFVAFGENTKTVARLKKHNIKAYPIEELKSQPQAKKHQSEQLKLNLFLN
ncbi:MAG: MBL fold metallo-hydrolase [Candidatus Anstonellaceae archaeon]